MQQLLEQFEKNLGLKFESIGKNQFRFECKFENEFLIAINLTYDKDLIICTLTNKRNETLSTTIKTLEDFMKWLLNNQFEFYQIPSLLADIRVFKLNYLLKDLDDIEKEIYNQNKL